MPDNETYHLTREDPKAAVVEGICARLVAEPRLGVARLQIMTDDADAWFETTLGVQAPAALSHIQIGLVSIAWLAPAEWLATGPEKDVEQIRIRCAEAAGPHGLMVDLSHGRISFELCGRAARAVIASHCPLDLSDAAMPVGAAMRSVFSDTGFFISRHPDRDDQPCYRLVFDQAMAAYAGRMLGATLSNGAV